MKWMLALVLTAGALLGPGAASATAVDEIPRKGGDVSWPNCPKGVGIPSRKGQDQPLPKKHAKFAIVGLTNGPGFYPNPCIDSQVAKLRARGLYLGVYAMTTFPKRTQIAQYGTAGPWPDSGRRNRLRNTGYAQAMFNIDTMKRVGLAAKFIWVDVEHYPVAPWTGNRARNKAVLDGAVRGYREAGLDVGFYTSPGPWKEIIGTARYGLPEWRTAGGHPWSDTGYPDARRMCRATSVQGGTVLVGQWWDTKRDYDVLCPAARSAGMVARLFMAPGEYAR